MRKFAKIYYNESPGTQSQPNRQNWELYGYAELFSENWDRFPHKRTYTARIINHIPKRIDKFITLKQITFI